MKQGLLFKEAPEPRAELYCYKCTVNFYTGYEYQQHRKKIHNEIYALHWNGYDYYGHWEEIKYLEKKDSGVCRNDKGELIEKPWKTLSRPSQRCKSNQKEQANLRAGKCFCGKPKKDFDKYQRKYCTSRHSSEWYSRNLSMGQHRDRFLFKHGNFCDGCSKKVESSYDMEMDHVIAIILGGHPWDERNLQALCSTCHKKKTRQDLIIYKFWKDQQWYDPVFCRPDAGPGTQALIELYVKT